MKALLDAAGVAYTVNPSIVRGLDYYTRTVFEFLAEIDGKELAVCAGGRYDGLVEELGGQHTPALGFGLGMERLLLLLQAQGVELPGMEPCEVFLGYLGGAAKAAAFRLCTELWKSGVHANVRRERPRAEGADEIRRQAGGRLLPCAGRRRARAGESGAEEHENGREKEDLAGRFASSTIT